VKCDFGIDFISSQMITYAVPYWFSLNFAYSLETWSTQCLLLLWQTGSIRPIFMVHKLRFRQFWDSEGL